MGDGYAYTWYLMTKMHVKNIWVFCLYWCQVLNIWKKKSAWVFFLDKLHHVLIWVVWYCRRKPVFLLCSRKKPNPVKSTSFALFSFHLACSSWTNTLLPHSWSFISVLLFRSHIHTDDNFCSPVSAAWETQVLLLSWGSLKHKELHT